MIPLRDETRVDRFPFVTCALVLANVLAFLWQVDLPSWPRALDAGHLLATVDLHLRQSILRGGAIPYEILTRTDVDYRDLVPPPFTILTSMFLHGGLGHIAFNMLFLWIFGNNVEDALGRLRFLAFYLSSGIAAALVQVVASAVTGDLLAPLIGASGAIAGVLAAYLLLFPRGRILTLVVIFVLIRLMPLPASWFIGLWFAGQLLAVFLGANTGVAFFAHIGGFLAGLVLVRVLGRRRGWRVRGLAR